MFNLNLKSKLEFYAEKKERHDSPLEEWVNHHLRKTQNQLFISYNRLKLFTDKVNYYYADLTSLRQSEIQERLHFLKTALIENGFEEEVVAQTFALIKEVSRRLLGMAHFDTQIMSGFVILQGKLAEMDTGEGKTLAATLPAATIALAGIPVHVLTVNEYLVTRDAELLAPLYEALGLSVSYVINQMSHEEKKEAYASNIVYCTNKQIAFDYLRDQLTVKNSNGRFNQIYEQLQNYKQERP